jgi:hypothetical protein
MCVGSAEIPVMNLTNNSSYLDRGVCMSDLTCFVGIIISFQVFFLKEQYPYK